MPIPSELLDLGPDNQATVAWLLAHWGVLQALRKVAWPLFMKPAASTTGSPGRHRGRQARASGLVARTTKAERIAVLRRFATLRVHDAVCEGASYREIAVILYGGRSARLGRESGSDFLRLRVQRLARAGNHMMSGGYTSGQI